MNPTDKNESANAAWIRLQAQHGERRQSNSFWLCQSQDWGRWVCIGLIGTKRSIKEEMKEKMQGLKLTHWYIQRYDLQSKEVEGFMKDHEVGVLYQEEPKIIV